VVNLILHTMTGSSAKSKALYLLLLRAHRRDCTYILISTGKPGGMLLLHIIERGGTFHEPASLRKEAWFFVLEALQTCTSGSGIFADIPKVLAVLTSC